MTYGEDIPVPALYSTETEQGNTKLIIYHVPPNSGQSNPYCQPKNKTSLAQISKSENQDNLKRKTSWRALFMMLSSLVSATVLSILHDAMNRSLNGNTVDSNGLWSQKWTSRYGTALAFLIRMLFVICVGTAFVQRQWLNLSIQSIRIRNLDVLSSALYTPFSLVSNSIWLKNPLLLMTAVISWTLPFATIVTPGALSVELRPHSYSANHTALKLSYDQKLMADAHIGFSSNEVMYYTTPTAQLSKVVFTAAISSQILSLKPDFANQTYRTNFTGPAIKCVDADSTVTASVQDFGEILGISYLGYIGDTIPSSMALSDSPKVVFYTSVPDTCSPPKNGTESNSLWILAASDNHPSGPVAPYHVKECQLWNASYEVEFAYQNFESTTTIRDFAYLEIVPLISSVDCSTFNPDTNFTISTNWFPKVVLSAFNSLIVGVTRDGSLFLDMDSIKESYFNLLNINVSNSTQFTKDIEELFKNVTVSLFSVPEFLANTTDTTSMTITAWSSTYVYQQLDLLLAYGLSFLASLICCTIGVHSFFRNGSSFQNNFSTYVRAAQGSDFDVRYISTGDTGADPLPKEIGEKMIKMASRPA